MKYILLTGLLAHNTALDKHAILQFEKVFVMSVVFFIYHCCL